VEFLLFIYFISCLERSCHWSDRGTCFGWCEAEYKEYIEVHRIRNNDFSSLLSDDQNW